MNSVHLSYFKVCETSKTLNTHTHTPCTPPLLLMFLKKKKYMPYIQMYSNPLFASLYENRVCIISRQSQELHYVDSPWNGFKQSLIALAATVSLLALSIIISNLPDQIAALYRVDITTSLIAILKPSFHFPSPLPPSLSPPCLAWPPILIEMKQFVIFLQHYLDVACGNVMSTNWTPKCLYHPSPPLSSPPSFL